MKKTNVAKVVGTLIFSAILVGACLFAVGCEKKKITEEEVPQIAEEAAEEIARAAYDNDMTAFHKTVYVLLSSVDYNEEENVYTVYVKHLFMAYGRNGSVYRPDESQMTRVVYRYTLTIDARTGEASTGGTILEETHQP